MFLRYAITDRSQTSHNGQNDHSFEESDSGLARQSTYLAGAGVDFLQIREKDLGAAAIAALARRLLETLQGSSTRLLINSRADIAVAVAAHGVHLTSSSDELSADQVRGIYAKASLPVPVVTLSCHTLDDVATHRSDGLTAILFGPIFEKVLAGDARLEGIGLERLRQACEAAAPVPVLALGGITTETIADCIAAGAAGVAGIRLFQYG
ncbi:thiamine phosphate synthase [Granulicella arctica]|uniref:thiamine phosphate synthase n=1 Tax=Granulicella arctica TaxID=940613 RepID=UPI0021E013B0|nr:thiamine phosphate synthase [Granulicella arctica]